MAHKTANYQLKVSQHIKKLKHQLSDAGKTPLSYPQEIQLPLIKKFPKFSLRRPVDRLTSVPRPVFSAATVI